MHASSHLFGISYLFDMISLIFSDDKTRLSLKLRIIEKRKKGGSNNQKSEREREIESALYQAVQAAYISLLLEVGNWKISAVFLLLG
jgi:hypothetical protein